jgi:integrase
MQARGKGSITELGNGRHWARAPDTRRTSLGVYPTRQEAETALSEGRRQLRAAGKTRVGLTFAELAKEVLDLREKSGIRSTAEERLRFRKHLESSALADMLVKEIRPLHVRELLRSVGAKQADDGQGKRKLSRATVQRVKALASAIFEEAKEREIRDDNPCVGVKIRKSDASDTDDKWTWLMGDEQRAFHSAAVNEADKLLVEFAFGTGLRQGEQWNLHLADVQVKGDDPYVFVRYGSKGKAPKNGKTRRVPLFGIALAAAKRWLELLPKRTNPLKLMWPTETGCVRTRGAPSKSVRDVKGHQTKVELLPLWLGSAGITRGVRWHDLRHTCASSLVSGEWGPPWTLEECCAMLGHSSIIVTQRYAHLGESALKRAAKKTSGVPSRAVTDLVTRPAGGGHADAAISSEMPCFQGDFDLVGRAGLEPATYGLKVAFRSPRGVAKQPVYRPFVI